MRLLNRTSLSAKRYGADSLEYNDKYEEVYGNPTDIPFKCSLQPITRGQDVRILPEGTTSKDAYLIYTKTELLEANEFTKQKADEIEIKGKAYKIHNVSDWSGYGTKIDHYRCILIRNDKK